MKITTRNGYTFTIDDEDYEKIKGHCWYGYTYPRGTSYIQTRIVVEGKVKILGIHRLIMNAVNGTQIDHVNCDGLDNRKSNLRFCTNAENTRNRKKQTGSSEYKGVSWHKAARKWSAQITVNYKKIHLGLFITEKAAASAYDQACLEHFREFARPNERG